MCGIAGFTGPGLDARAHLDDMLAALAHRGPDAGAVFIDGALALAHRRLAVIDMDGGAQPRADTDTGDALVFNGEIYGYKALQDGLRAQGIVLRDRSDTEVLFQMLRHFGVRETLARIDGMFAFAFRCGASGRLYLARDRFGEKPLYYAQFGEALVFGSEVSAILCHPASGGGSPDPLAAYALLQFEYLPGALSGWRGIAKLPAASLLTFEAGRAEVERYWRPPPPASGIAAGAAVERLDALLQDAVRQCAVADVPLGVFLSGGLDSSLLTAIAARSLPDITAMTVRVGHGNFDETPYAADVARHVGVRHELVELGDADLVHALDAVTAHLSEPLADSSLLPTYLVCRAARARMTVALGGDGADELFAGYPNFSVQRFAFLMQCVPRAAGRALMALLDALPPGTGYMSLRFRLAQLAQGFGAAPARQSFLWMAPFSPAAMQGLWQPGQHPDALGEAAFAPIDAAAREAGTADAVETLLRQFLVTYLPDDILMKTDRAAMFNGLEVRAPFLHRPLAAYAAALPAHLKCRGVSGKHILKQVARRYLPDHIVDRRKHGFAVPIGCLLRGVFRERLRDTLMSRQNPVAAWFERGRIEQLLGAHDSARRDHGKRLWALYILFTVAARKRPARPSHQDMIGMQVSDEHIRHA
jgi:asparagine synthase (glutamine-hydrolysing)